MAGAAVQLAVRTQANKSKLSRPLSASVAESVEYVGGNELRAFLQATVPEGCPCAVLGLPPYPFSRLAICGGLDGLATKLAAETSNGLAPAIPETHATLPDRS